MNLAQKTTLHADGKKSGNVNIPQEVLRVLADLNHDLDRYMHILVVGVTVSLLLMCQVTCQVHNLDEYVYKKS